MAPFSSTRSPCRTSSPAGRTSAPCWTETLIAISSMLRPEFLRSTSSVSSKGTTESAPSGTGAPVMIRMVVPGRTTSVGSDPAATRPMTFSDTGDSVDAPWRSPACTA